MWPPPYVPFSDVEFDAWTDEVAVGTFDDGFIPARLPGRRNHFQHVAASSCRGPSTVLGGPVESHGQRGGAILSASPRSVVPSSVQPSGAHRPAA